MANVVSAKQEIERKLWDAKLKLQKLEQEFASLEEQVGPLIIRRDEVARLLKAAADRVDKLTKMLAA